MLTSHSPVALLMPTQDQVDLFLQALAECQFRKITIFTSASEAYEVCTRQQFPLFITRMEMPGMNGIVFVQKLRQSGEYGGETHLFACDKLDPSLLNLIEEYDLDHVLTAPFSKETIKQKFKHLIAVENALSPQERCYRDAKAAFNADNDTMAESFAKTLIKDNIKIEKALVLMGEIKIKRQDYEEAYFYFKEALEINPRSTIAMHKMAGLMMIEGHYDKATDILNKLADISPLNIKILEQAGLSNLEVEHYAEAKAHMSRLSNIDAGNRTAAHVTAQVMIKTGEYDGLVAVLSKSYDEKELIQYLNNAGAKLSQDDDIKGAIRMYQAAIAQISDSKFLYAIHYNMGIAYKKLTDFNTARVHFERSLKLKPDFDKAFQALKDLEKSRPKN